MITLFTLVFTDLFSTLCLAKNGINYKVIIKDARGNVVANNLLVLQFTFLQNLDQTNISKKQTSTTNTFGCMSLRYHNWISVLV